MSSTPAAPRRRFLTQAASAGAAVLGGTALAGCDRPAPPAPPPSAPPAEGSLRLRMQTAWPAEDLFHEYALDFADKVRQMSSGRLTLDVLPAGAVVPTFQLLDGVSSGTLDAAHSVLVYDYGRSPAFGLWGSGPSFGMDANMVLAWHRYGGGRALLEEIHRALDLQVVPFLYGPMPTQPFGWFREPVRRLEDLKGMKFRTVGLAVEVFTAMGLAVNPLPAGEIVPALQRGLIDAAEFNNATSDRLLGFPGVARHCMLQSFHQSGEQFEVLFNKSVFESLSPELRTILDCAAQAASADMSWKAIERNSRDYLAVKQAGVQFHRTPDAILRAELAAWDAVVARKAAEDPLFGKVLESQRAFAARAGRWQRDYTVDAKMAYDHYFDGLPSKG